MGVERPLVRVRMHGKNAGVIPDKHIEGIRIFSNMASALILTWDIFSRQQIESNYYLSIASLHAQEKYLFP